MKRRALTLLAAGGLCALCAYAVAQDRDGAPRPGESRFGEAGWGGLGRVMERFSPADREAMVDARIAALHAGLKLSADQEKLWPAVEDAIRNLVRIRREQGRAWRERLGGDAGERLMNDVPGALRAMADAGAQRADAIRRLADASGPLYATLDDGQKRRLLVLARPLAGLGMPGMRHGHERMMHR